MLVEMIAKRKKFFAAQRATEQRSKPPTKTLIRNRMCAYLKNMGGYKHNQLKGLSYEEIHKLYDKAHKQVNSFDPMDSEVVKSSETRTEGNYKRVGDELESDKSKKQKIDVHVAINAIPLATKPLMIVKYKIDKDRRIGYFKLIRADGSSKRYSSMIKMLQDIDREDLETLWKLVKAKHGNTRPEEDYERVLWGDLKGDNNRVIDLENTKTAQAHEITSLKLRVKKLEKKGGSRTHKLKILYKGSAASITDVEITLAQALAELKSAKPTTATSIRPKAKGLVIHEQEQAPTPIVSSQQPSQAKIQNKGKAKIILLNLIEREKAEANIDLKETWDDIQAKIEEKRRKHFAAKRSEEKRNIPPTKAQQRSIMCTYLKNMEGWKPKDLKSNSKKAKAEIAQESSSKRAGDKLEQESIKKQKVDEDKETEELKGLMEVIPGEEEVAVDAIPLATKPPSIIDWKIHKE
ncbi:hypothetical protein Tco_0813870 [Tanacetum coccineum]